MINLNYVQERDTFKNLYNKCYSESGPKLMTTNENKVALIKAAQTFSLKAGLSTNQTYFGSIERACPNDTEIMKLYAVIRYDV